MTPLNKILDSCVGFDWDSGNQLKNWMKHGVDNSEAEQVFFNQPQVLFKDKKHSDTEPRLGILGRTDEGRELAVFFTIRNDKIRIISARDQKRKGERVRFKIKQKEYDEK